MSALVGTVLEAWPTPCADLEERQTDPWSCGAGGEMTERAGADRVEAIIPVPLWFVILGGTGPGERLASLMGSGAETCRSSACLEAWPSKPSKLRGFLCQDMTDYP